MNYFRLSTLPKNNRRQNKFIYLFILFCTVIFIFVNISYKNDFNKRRKAIDYLNSRENIILKVRKIPRGGFYFCLK